MPLTPILGACILHQDGSILLVAPLLDTSPVHIAEVEGRHLADDPLLRRALVLIGDESDEVSELELRRIET